MVREYLKTLKNKGNFSWSDLSKISGLPDATIRKIFSGETIDPRFETVAKLVKAMGGSLDEIIDGPREGVADTNAVIAIKEVYENRINDLKSSYTERISSLIKDKKILIATVFILGAILLITLIIDIFMGNIGWIQY